MTLNIQTLKPARGSKHAIKRVGRGNASGHGSYSGHGGKGQTARSGGSRGLQRKAFRSLMLSTPKLRGFHSQMTKPAEVYLSELDKNYKTGELVDLKTLIEKKIVPETARAAKVLSKGELNKKLTVSGVKCTAGAKAAIEKAGGEVK